MRGCLENLMISETRSRPSIVASKLPSSQSAELSRKVILHRGVS